ncbi:hypothetical protein GGR53DRAFT_490691 [Hypoxylon sp. FL1150]|nr:hypothetical protein GGR53DRAFT_490691 [Hypoxylon sp. FL1150]
MRVIKSSKHFLCHLIKGLVLKLPLSFTGLSLITIANKKQYHPFISIFIITGQQTWPPFFILQAMIIYQSKENALESNQGYLG